MPSRYTFVDYSPEWPAEFEREAALLRSLLGRELICLHHIGSTSVPGLAAKPVIDLMPIARSLGQLDHLGESFERAGYQVRGEFGIPGRRYITKDRDGLRTHNLHFFQDGDPQIERHLAFCAYLRAHESVRDEYAALKREAYARHPADIEAYNDSKNAWIKRIERLAVDWYRSQGILG